MYAFVGYSDLSVNHIDGNKENNNLSNLEYATAKEQAIHRSRVLRVGNRKSVMCLETQEVFETTKDAGISKGADPSHISGVCKNKYGYKTAGGYHWKYV